MIQITANDFFSLYLKYNYGIELGFKFQLSPPTVITDGKFHPHNAIVELTPQLGYGELVKTVIPVYQLDLTNYPSVVLQKGNRTHVSDLLNDLREKLNAGFMFNGEECLISLTANDIYDVTLPTPPIDGSSLVNVQIKESCFFFKGILSIKLTP